MKKVQAIIKNDKVQAVLDALLDFDIWGVTEISARGAGRQKGYDGVYIDKNARVKLRQNTILEFVVSDDVVKPLIDVIVKVNSTGEVARGNGKIFVIPVEDAVRISTKERGEKAIKE